MKSQFINTSVVMLLSLALFSASFVVDISTNVAEARPSQGKAHGGKFSGKPSHRPSKPGHRPGKPHHGHKHKQHHRHHHHHHHYHGYHYGPWAGFATGIVIGAIVASLPRHTRTVYVQGQPYYYHDGVYYQKHPQGYQVVKTP